MDLCYPCFPFLVNKIFFMVILTTYSQKLPHTVFIRNDSTKNFYYDLFIKNYLNYFNSAY